MSYDIRFGMNVAETNKDMYAVIGQPEHSMAGGEGHVQD